MSKIEANLQQNLTQALNLTPQMIQSMKVLQMNDLELSVYVSQIQETNPFLEVDLPEDERLEEDDILVDECYTDEQNSPGKAGDDGFLDLTAAKETLQDHLIFQLMGTDLSQKEYSNCECLIYSIDDRGYLLTSVEEAAEDLGETVENMNKALKIVQTFDPAGVGARDLKECLRLQAQSMGVLSDEMIMVIDHGLDDLRNGNVRDAARSTGLSRSTLEKCLAILREMEPFPGRSFSSQTPVQYIIPDVEVVRFDDGEQGSDVLEIRTINRYMPSVRISHLYDEIKEKLTDSPELREYVRKNMEEAQDLISCIRRRESTLLRITRFLATYNKIFFLEPEGLLRPLTMEQVAEELRISPSTVSRAVSGKYLQCGRGVLPLRQFFSAGYREKRDTDDVADGGTGAVESVSAVSVREEIKKLVSHEDPRHPLSDEKIRGLLQEKGIEISRRTVAKYRGIMGIGSASERKVR